MADTTSQSARYSRRILVKHLSLALVAFGAEARSLTVSGDLTVPQLRRLLPAGLLGAIGGELLASVAFLTADRWAYASAALVRQLVEVEYLAWAVTNDPEDAWEWMKADRETRLKRWQPKKIRQRSDGRFPNSDYHSHCEAGGHPVPEPAMNILDHRDEWVEVCLYEAALHGAATWHYLLSAIGDAGPLPSVTRHHVTVDKAWGAWQDTETLGARF